MSLLTKKTGLADPHTSAVIGIDLSAALADIVAHATTPGKVLGAAIVARLKKSRIRLLHSDRGTLEALCNSAYATGNWSSVDEWIKGKARDRDLHIEFHAKDVDRALRIITKAIDQITPKIILKSAKAVAPDFTKRLKAYNAERAQELTRFTRRLDRTYRSSFESYSCFLSACIVAGDSMLRSFAPPVVVRQTARRAALLRIHHRACRVAIEVEMLLRAGMSDGALARWRTLHELAVCASFIAKMPAKVARKYLQHEAFQRRKIDNAIRDSAADAHSAQDAAQDANSDLLIARLQASYGPDYGDDYGWAASALGCRRVTFYDLEKASGYGGARVAYYKANAAVHASSLGLTYRPSMNSNPESGTTLEWAIATNLGLTTPARLSTWSLSCATMTLLTSAPSPERTVLMHLISQLENQASRAFERVQQRIERREAMIVAKGGNGARS